MFAKILIAQMFKKWSHKMLFIIPILGLIISYSNHSYSPLVHSLQQTKVDKVQSNSLNSFSLYSEIEESNDCDNFFFEESELEDSFEYDGLLLNSNSGDFVSLINENKKLYNKSSFTYTHTSTPLYVLFCNWKHQLS